MNFNHISLPKFAKSSDLDYLKGRYVIDLTESWLTADMPGSAIKFYGCNLCRVDRTVLISKRRWCSYLFLFSFTKTLE